MHPVRRVRSDSAPLSAALLALAFSTVSYVSSRAGTLSAWVELTGPGPQASIRAIVTPDSECPVLNADGEPLRMQTRAEPGPLFAGGPYVPLAPFPVRTCEAPVPYGANAVLLDGRALPVPRAEVRRVVVFGDTGCRVKNHADQGCGNPATWPYAQVALKAAEAGPDLVLHVGDYLYRERACSLEAGCYGWQEWNADFFAPSAPLLAVAPWTLVRGNHEICSRAGEGWFRFLDHAAPPRECKQMSDPFTASFGDLGLIVIDSAMAADPDIMDEEEEGRHDSAGRADLIGEMRGGFAKISGAIPADAWVMTHRPFNAVRANKHGEGQVDSRVQQEAIGGELPAGVEMIVSGHIHLFEAISFGNADRAMPPQLVVGTGGANLVEPPPTPTTIDNVRVTASVIDASFGYMIWDRSGTGWSGEFYDADGTALIHCDLMNRNLNCKKDR